MKSSGGGSGNGIRHPLSLSLWAILCVALSRFFCEDSYLDIQICGRELNHQRTERGRAAGRGWSVGVVGRSRQQRQQHQSLFELRNLGDEEPRRAGWEKLFIQWPVKVLIVFYSTPKRVAWGGWGGREGGGVRDPSQGDIFLYLSDPIQTGGPPSLSL